MTFCIGWKFKNQVFIFGDTLFTQNTTLDDPENRKTSFGELQGNTNIHGKPAFVEENGIKVKAFANGAIAYAGSVAIAEAMAEIVESSMTAGRSALEALQLALHNVQPVKESEHTSLLLTCRQANEIALYLLDTKNLGSIKKVEGLVQIGSIGDHHKANTKSFISKIESDITNRFQPGFHSPKNLLAQISAYLQSIGVHDKILNEAVGGAFVGLCHSVNGIEWQPDTLYVVRSPIPTSDNIFCCGVFVRNQVLGLISTASEINKFIAWKSIHEENSDTHNRINEASKEITKKFDSGMFEFLVVLNSGIHTATIVEMKNNTYHKLVFIDTLNPIIDGKIGIIWTDTLLRAINAIQRDSDGRQPDLSVMSLPYIPPDEDDIAEAEALFQKNYDLDFDSQYS